MFIHFKHIDKRLRRRPNVFSLSAANGIWRGAFGPMLNPNWRRLELLDRRTIVQPRPPLSVILPPKKEQKHEKGERKGATELEGPKYHPWIRRPRLLIQVSAPLIRRGNFSAMRISRHQKRTTRAIRRHSNPCVGISTRMRVSPRGEGNAAAACANKWRENRITVGNLTPSR